MNANIPDKQKCFPAAKIPVTTRCRAMLADVFTPVGIYLRLRDRFRDTILLESGDHHTVVNSYSFICINAIAGIELNSEGLEWKLPTGKIQKHKLTQVEKLDDLLWQFLQQFSFAGGDNKTSRYAQGFYGYFSYDTAGLIEPGAFNAGKDKDAMPDVRYRLYQYVIAIDHFRDEMVLLENILPGVESEVEELESLIRSKDVPVYPFTPVGEKSSNMTDESYMEMVAKGVAACHRGDVFQVVLSKSFEQPFLGDEFNVYRALRNVNPSPYLFYFDYGDYKLMGSSPEAQLIIKNGKAVMHPIAGTVKRTGDDEQDEQQAAVLVADEKENAEHVMLVDLARNDLSRSCSDVMVSRYREVQYYSHVIHMVSQVEGTLPAGANPFETLFNCFPAGTLSGAPKYRAMQLINEWEPTRRAFYGGAIGFVGNDGSCNHAIMIRTLLSRNNKLQLRAGAGVVARSEPANELKEVDNKLGALNAAIKKAAQIQ